MIYRTPNIEPDFDYEQIKGNGLIVRGAQTGHDSLSILWYNELGTNLNSNFTVFDSLSLIYRSKEILVNTCRSAYMQLLSGSAYHSDFSTGAVNAIEIYYTKQERSGFR
jgi:hypothetical protein